MWAEIDPKMEGKSCIRVRKEKAVLAETEYSLNDQEPSLCLVVKATKASVAYREQLEAL